VAGELAEALGSVLRERPRVFGAGRTDAGVHAMAQVASFQTGSTLGLREIRERLNDALPADICVLGAEEVPASFHARHSAISRTYRYQISRRRTAFAKRFVWWVRSPLDEAILHRTAGAILAARSFSSYADEDSRSTDTSPRRTGARVQVMESCWIDEADLLIYRIRADRFLWKLVRRLVGAMVAAALGQIAPEDPERWLTEPSGEPARLTAPPSGLFLESVEYPPALLSPASHKGPRRSFRRPAHRGKSRR